MKEYDITITETLEKTVSVTAPDRAAAEEKVRQGYFNSEYVLDSDNFTGVKFAAGEGHEVTAGKETMDVLLVKPGEFPQPYKAGKELEDLQEAVGGDIQAVYPFEDEVCIICNEEGKINGMPLNRALRDEEGQMYDIIAGDFLVVGLTEDDFGSLTPEQMGKYEKAFHSPEAFVRMGKGLIALPIDDETVKKNARDKAADAPKKAAPGHDAL